MEIVKVESLRRPSSFSTLTNVLLGFLLIGPLAGMGLASIFYTGDLMSDIDSGKSNSTLARAMMLTQGTITFVGLILIPTIQVTVIERKPLEGFFPQRSLHPILLLLFSIATMIFIVAISPITEWNAAWKLPTMLSDFENWAIAAQERSVRVVSILTSQTSIAYVLGSSIVVALLPAIGEEFVFRGIIQNHLVSKYVNYHTAIWVTAAIFSVAHFQIYGLIPRLMFGAFFGYAYHWSKNLIYPIAMHFVNNALILMLSYGTIVNSEKFSVDQLNSLSAGWVLLADISLVVIIYIASGIRADRK